MNDRKEYLIPEKDKQEGEFMSRLLKFLLLSVSFTLLLSMTLKVGVVKAEQLTGCLKIDGKLSKFALGDSSLRPCKSEETEVSIASDDLESDNPDPPCFDNFNRYVECGNGTVTDTVTGLIWLQDANCLMGSTDWKSANEFAAGLADGQCGLSDRSKRGDWRLPTLEEWQATIARAVALGCCSGSPAACGANPDLDPPSLTDRAGTGCFSTDANPAFSGVQFFYWSSLTRADKPGQAFVAFLGFGVLDDAFKVDTTRAWPVRGGP